MLADLASMYRTMHLDGYKPDMVVGITRGGLVPSVYASHYFGVPLTTINISFRDTEIIDPLTPLIELIGHKKLLFVDDICDSGETLEHIYEGLMVADPLGTATNFKSAVMIHNDACQRFTPSYTGTHVNKMEKDVWIVFDWEQ